MGYMAVSVYFRQPPVTTLFEHDFVENDGARDTENNVVVKISSRFVIIRWACYLDTSCKVLFLDKKEIGKSADSTVPSPRHGIPRKPPQMRHIFAPHPVTRCTYLAHARKTHPKPFM